MRYAQIHCHTKYSLSKTLECLTTPKQLLKRAKKKGLSAVAITDHNTMEGSIAAQKLADKYGITIIPAIEVDTDAKGQVLAYGIKSNIQSNRSAFEIINDIHSQNGVAIIPHPFDIFHAMENLDDVVKHADGIETLNLGVFRNKKAQKYAKRKNIKVQTGSSDAHTHLLIDSVVMGFSDTCKTAADYVSAIKNGDFTVVRRKPYLLALLVAMLNLAAVTLVKPFINTKI